jgi:transposase
MSQKTAAVARTSMAARVAANTVPGIGPLIASAMVAAIGNGAAFAKATVLPLPRAVTLPPGSAWCRSRLSTGDRTILGRISKRGNRYLRTMIMQGARGARAAVVDDWPVPPWRNGGTGADW